MADARKVRTSRLRRRHGIDASIRLTKRDRAFLADLAKVGVIDVSTADRFHYAENASGSAKRLEKLAAAGILKRADIIDPSHGRISVYSFADGSVARSFGGRAAYTGSNRTTYHELLVSRAYFDLGRPEDFKLASRFSAKEMSQFGAAAPVPPHLRDAQTHHAVASEAAIPDAVFTDSNGQLVVVEADSGHYTTRQIRQKQSQWSGYRQVWVQPARPHAKVKPAENVNVFTY